MLVQRKRTIRLVKKLEKLVREQQLLRRHLDVLEHRLYTVNELMTRVQVELDEIGAPSIGTPPSKTKAS